METKEKARIEAYLQRKFHPGLRIVERPKDKDSLEVYMGDEFLAVIYKDVDEGETAFHFQMTILAEDLGM